MKNEEKIIELLTKHLQKIDRRLDRLDKHDGVFENQFKILMANSKQIESLQKDSLEHTKQI